ncbi:MAG: MBOAT family protein [Spirochaetaceae bacterium]|nr:MBOAT family protein [Spirochaetaceae bacterium]
MIFYMLFSSVTFLGFFFPVIFILYYIIPNRTYKNTLLLFSSLLFYAWGEPKFIFLMVLSIVFNYLMGRLIASKQKKIFLIIAIVINIAVLFVFKYLGFTCEIINRIISSLHIKPLETINLILPIGISFYTFQEITYLVDVYKKPELVQKNPLNLGLYISFFPQLIAGPIVRYHDINLQIEKRNENIEKVSQGFQRFIIGLSKKVIIANNLALVCDSIYNADFYSYGAAAVWIASISYSLQIYYDFSGYSDMAIGLAKIFGFNLKENFNYPYAAESITDFWKRWHISLTDFFRDYVYIPLGGNRISKKRTIINRYIVFFLTGLWHGAAVNFILWGLLHGTAMILERLSAIKEKLSKVFKAIYRIITLLTINFLWILFRNDTKDSIKLILKMFGINFRLFTNSGYQEIVKMDLLWFYVDTKFFIILFLSILFAFPWWKKISFFEKRRYANILNPVKLLISICLLIICFAFLANNTYNPFIYFRF